MRKRQEQTPPEAGVYLIRNRETGTESLGASPNPASVRNKLAFSQSTGTSGAPDRRLHADVARFGVAACTFDVLEPLDVRHEMTPADIEADLATLEDRWRETIDPALRS